MTAMHLVTIYPFAGTVGCCCGWVVTGLPADTDFDERFDQHLDDVRGWDTLVNPRPVTDD